jgi:hypothetical protein
VKTESIKLERIQIILKANFLINCLSEIFGYKVKKRNLQKLLYFSYGLTTKESAILIKASRGVFKDYKIIDAIINKCFQELKSFLTCVEQYNYIIKAILVNYYEF